MDLAERGLAMRYIGNSAQEEAIPDVDWDYAECYSKGPWSWLRMKVLALDTLMDWVRMGGSSVAWWMCGRWCGGALGGSRGVHWPWPWPR